ncbi:DUF1963 domain-containing protein [Sphingomonas azotifigens]|uniref:DUF1963 domain-containing protein n=1 Tax=Sphingomonas azotifigens TaxID=330920 RepID=UPI0009FFB693|nr:YwqG family protein [Sphingomonas azotifigens]
MADEVESLFEKYRRDAVLLHRPYPPYEAAKGLSKFGGLPSLPSNYAWPRTPEGLPLHFLAQIDCRDISFPTILPDQGVLFFFGRCDMEQLWETNEPDRNCRVIFAPEGAAGIRERQPPADLPPIGGGYPRPRWICGVPPTQASGPNQHFEWPITPIRIHSWPDPSALPAENCPPQPWRGLGLYGLVYAEDLYPEEWNTFCEYHDDQRQLQTAYRLKLEQRRAESIYAATGRTPTTHDKWDIHLDLSKALMGHDFDGGICPWRWIYVRFLCMALSVETADSPLPLADPHIVEEGIHYWLDRANRADPADALPDDAGRELNKWIKNIRSGGRTERLILDVVATAIRSFAGTPELARKIDPVIYELVAPVFCDNTIPEMMFSQMLGHAPSVQTAKFVEDRNICLINIASERDSTGWSFGDRGYCSFWISLQDLWNRNFNNSWGTIMGS